jgi:hypothetical protein
MIAYNITSITPEGIHYKRPGKGGGYFAAYPLPTEQILQWSWVENLDGIMTHIEWDGRTSAGENENGETQYIYQKDIIPVADIEQAIQTATTPTLDQRKQRALATLKANRDEALAAGFEFQGKQFQTRNAQDVLNITNVGIGAMADANFQTAFLSTDNVPVVMDAPTAMQFYATMLEAGNAIWQRYGLTRAQLEQAQSEEQLQAINLGF